MNWIVAIAVLAFGACSDDTLEQENRALEACAPGQVGLALISSVPETPLAEDLVVRGTATHSQGLAIRSVSVLGIEARKDAFNFAAWSATLPFSVLKAQANATTGALAVTVEAVDACDERSALPEAERPELRVDRLPISDLEFGAPRYPSNQAAIPASGSAVVSIPITANASAAGASLRVTAPRGDVLSSAGGSVRLEPGDDLAEALVLFRAEGAGSVLLEARTLDGALLDVVQVEVAAPPRISPTSASLGPSQTVAIGVESTIDLDICEVTDTAAAAVEMTGTGPSRSIDLVAAAELASATTIRVRCIDIFGQRAEGAYTVAP
jgi:hypothetical protein